MRAQLSWHLLAILVSGLMIYGYARGYYALGFIALVPWICALAHSGRTLALLSGMVMSMVFTLAVFAWFGAAIAAYTGLGSIASQLLIAALAPLWQPQFWLFALTQSLRRGALSGAGLGVATAIWIVSEWLLPKVLGDTLGHGLAPSLWLRQGADLAGTAGLTAVLLLANGALALAWTRRNEARRRWLAPLIAAILLPAALGSYGALRLYSLEPYFAEPAPSIRIGMVQTSLVDYENRRNQQGSYAVVREILDRHVSLSQAAIAHHGAEALIWSETIYPTPFGFPRSTDAAAFDHELKSFIDAIGIPLIFGSYDIDTLGEYNAAVLIDPKRPLTARYRKTRLFPFTEQIPAWLDTAWVRRALPWTGRWLPGDGARVLPLSTPDGRELNVVPLICLDDVDPELAVEGARLGAQAIVGLSNDSWFSDYPQGLELHLAVARVRSIETRLPQLRATTNGYTAFIDPSGEVLARTVVGDKAVLAGEVPIRTPPSTLVTLWGQWLEPTTVATLVLWGLFVVHRRLKTKHNAQRLDAIVPAHEPAEVIVVSDRVYTVIAALRFIALLALCAIAGSMLVAGWRVQSLTQIYGYLAFVVIPWLLAWQLQRSHRAFAHSDALALQIVRHSGSAQKLALADLQLAPSPGWSALAALRMLSTQGAKLNLLLDRSEACALAAQLMPASDARPNWLRLRWARLNARAKWLDQPGIKFLLFPLFMALPAFRLHQVISFGGTFGEYYSFGAWAYLQGLLIWWASWSLGLALWAAFLRVLIEAALFLLRWLGPGAALRELFEFAGRVLFYLAVPLWFFWRVSGA